MTDEEYKKRVLESLDSIIDYQKSTLVYLETMAQSPEFDLVKKDLASKMSDMKSMLEITKRRWSA